MATVAELLATAEVARVKQEAEHEAIRQNQQVERFALARKTLVRLLASLLTLKVNAESVYWESYNGSAAVNIDGIVFAKEAPRTMAFGYSSHDLTHVDVLVICPNKHIIYRRQGGAACWVNDAETLAKAVETIERESKTCESCVRTGQLQTLDQRWRAAVDAASRADLLVALEALRVHSLPTYVEATLDVLDRYRVQRADEAESAREFAVEVLP